MNHVARAGLSTVPLCLALWSCGTGPSSGSGQPAGQGSNEATGQLNLAITTVPPGVQCIQITATGSYTVSQSFAATPGANTVGSLSLGELPLGSVAITGQAFNVACASIGGAQPSWVADKQVVNLQAGVVTSLTITFRPDNPVTGTPSFVGNVVQIACGSFTGLVMSDGTVEEAGNLPFLANNGSSFGPVPALSNVAQLGAASSGLWDCALLKGGTVECWGNNGEGELGNGTTTNSSTPVAVSGLSSVTQIATGNSHACALESNGSLWCWGLNGSGQVGNGTTTNALTPVQVLSNVTSVACGQNHTCAIQNSLVNGSVNCWGYNGLGQIGNNTTADAHTPVALSVTAITQVSLGAIHTCALRTDGSVFCWGYNGDGELGLGNSSNSLTPAKVAISNVQQIATGSYTSCARRADGSVSCWGYDQFGTAGDGTGTTTGVLAPAQLAGLPPSALIAAGTYNACSLGTDQSLECWGYNGFGEIGNGTFNNAYAPTPVKP
jgi:hypothetical protein